MVSEGKAGSGEASAALRGRLTRGVGLSRRGARDARAACGVGRGSGAAGPGCGPRAG